MTKYPLQVIVPIDVMPGMLVSSSVPEDAASTWAAGTTYALGALVHVPDTHKRYRSVIDANVGQYPATSPKAWQELGATNRWAMFDQNASTRTTSASSINVVLQPGQAVSALALIGVHGASARVRVVDPQAGTVYDSTTSLLSLPQQVGWWHWFYGQRTPITQALHLALPPYPNAQVLVDIAGTNTACATLITGQRMAFGLGAQLGATVGINDFSRREFDEFGDLTLVERGFSDRASFTTLLARNEVDATRKLLARNRARPCLWIGSSLYESTTVYGIYRSFQVSIDYYDYSKCTLELEGLTTDD